MFSVALVIAFLAAEKEIRQLPHADFGRLLERFLLSVRTWTINENLVYWKLHPLFVFEVFRHIFSSWALAPTQLTIFLWGLSILLFSLINIKLTFLVSKGLLCLYDKQNNTRLLVDMEFLLSCSTRHLTRFLRSLVSYRVEYSKRNFTSTRVMYYSLCIDWVENGN